MSSKKSSCMLSVTGILLFSSAALAAENHQGPNFKGQMTAGFLSVEDRDADLWAFKLEAGLEGLYALDADLKLKYELVADFAGEVNDTDELTWSPGEVSDDEQDIYLRTARVLAITDYGALMFAPRTPSGQWAQLYGNIDRFDYNRFHAQTGSLAMFGQVEQAQDVFSYISPVFGGGFRFIGATLTIDDRNGEDTDAYSGRLVYNAAGLSLGIGHVMVKEEQLPTQEDYHRSAVTGGYDFGELGLGGTYEVNRDHPSGDFESYAVTAEYAFNADWSTALGYANKQHDNDQLDRDGIVANLKRHLNEQAYLFVETGQYDEAPDNIAAGISVRF